MKQIISTNDAPQPAGPYSQANVSLGRTIYVAGQVARNPVDNTLVPGGIEEQAVQVFENVAAVLKAAGATLRDVVKVNVYLSDIGDFAQMNAVYGRYFTTDFPARTTIQAVLAPGYLIEVDAVACVD